MTTLIATRPTIQQRSRRSSLTEALKASVANPVSSSEFDLAAATNDVLAEVGLSTAASGGRLSFYGADPIIPSRFKFGAIAAIGLAAKSVAAAALWRARSGEGQDIHVDVRKALRRFAGFFEGKWETINGRGPTMGAFAGDSFFAFPMFRKTRDGRHVIALNFYPKLRRASLQFLQCTDSLSAVENAILQWNADELESAAAERGLVIAKVRTTDEFLKEPQYTDVLADMPLITIEKIGDSDPVPFTKGAKNPLDGFRALGMGHVIAGAAIGRDLAMYGGDVLNTWRPDDTEVEGFAWDAQVGMRSTILAHSAEDRATFDRLLKDADVFFANKRPGYLERHGLNAQSLAEKKPGLIHASVLLHGDKGPWANRPGFDEVGAAVTGLFCIEGTPAEPKSPPITIAPIVDNVVGWLCTTGILEALRRRAEVGGGYRVTVSLTRTVLWLLSLGIFERSYAQTTAGSTDEHAYVAPNLFTAETPLGTYQGMTDQTIMSRTREAYRTVLEPRGSSKPKWLK